MVTSSESQMTGGLRHDLAALRGNWFWFVLLGVLLIVLGFAALGAVVVASLATALVIGGLLVAGGATEVLGSFWWTRDWSGFFLHMLSGLLSVVVGLLFLSAPINALLALTLLVACLLTVGGSFKIAAALSYRVPTRGPLLLSGLLDLVMGVLIWAQWPEAALWVIGMFVGINLIFRGVNWIGLGLAIRKLLPVNEN